MVTSVHMRVLRRRGEIIEWAGRVRAFPVEREAGVELARPGDEAPGPRTGWTGFFERLDRRHLVLVVESPDGFPHRFVSEHEAMQLPAEAFGPPWYERLWHEIVLLQPGAADQKQP